MSKSKSKLSTAEIELKSNTDYNIPKFSFKSSIYLIGGGILSTIVIPYLLSFLSVDSRLSIVLGNTFVLGFTLAYVRCFVESKKGYCKEFWITYGIFGAVFGFISYFWVYLEAFI